MLPTDPATKKPRPPLTDPAIKKAKPEEKPHKLSDSGGLFILIAPSGGKLWRMKYRFGGREKLLSFGSYPHLGLARARQLRDEAKRLLADGIDPGELKKATKTQKVERAANSFEVIAREWYAKHAPGWAASHGDKILRRLERDVFPWIGGKPIAELTAPEVLAVVRRIEARGALETAHRAQANCGQVLRYAVATGRATSDPTRDLRGALPPVRPTNFAAIIEPLAVGELLRAIDGFKGSLQVACALRLSPLLFVRPGELRTAKWADIDLDAAEWRYIASKTKTEHIVPLAAQAVAILRELQPLLGHHAHVFPGRDPKKPMSEAAINAALRRMGYDTKTEITGHGFRAMARTIIHEELGVRPEVIEHQLAHRVPDTLGTAYNRTKFLKERRAMMTAWADYLDKLKAEADVIPIHGKSA
jgi:integrase